MNLTEPPADFTMAALNFTVLCCGVMPYELSGPKHADR